MATLRARGLLPVLEDRAREAGIPVLGICLGMQMFSRRSEEGGEAGLGWIAAETRRLPATDAGRVIKVPHLGWNALEPHRPTSLLEGLPPEPTFYFAHAYHVACDDPADVLATARYGVDIAALVRRGNLYGAQFHPEKSHANGTCFLKRFLEATARA
jgi:glutamine amidotransferase